MALPDYSYLYDHACERKGGEKALKALLPKTKSKAHLKKLGSDRYLAEFTRKIFQSGFVWRVVDKKWPQFEDVFWEFDVERLLMMPDDMLERKAKDDTERREQQSFGEFIAGWPDDDVIGLWLYLKKHGSRLGGNTGPFALRTLGVDTFLLTQDVEGFLRSHDIVDSGITSQRALKAAQAYFNDLREQSGKSLAELSRLVSFCHGQNRTR
jgi:3-methyladenine DNA glycosylase Tag